MAPRGDPRGFLEEGRLFPGTHGVPGNAPCNSRTETGIVVPRPSPQGQDALNNRSAVRAAGTVRSHRVGESPNWTV